MTLLKLIIPILLAAAPATDGTTTTPPSVANPAVTTAGASTPQPAKLEFPQAGYRINGYTIASTASLTFVMSLPVPGKNSSFSVEIIYFGPTKGKPPLPVNFYPRSGYTVLFERRISPTELRVEFTRKQPDKPDKPGPLEHAYIRMIFANNILYNVTGTAPDADWPAVAAKLKASVDSFEPSSDSAPGKVAFPRQGFRINPLDEAIPADAKQRLLFMLSFDGLTAVSIEPYPKTLKDYQAERQPPFMLNAKSKFKVLAESVPTENALVTEFDAEDGTGLSYEKVVLAHGQLYRAVGALHHMGGDQSKNLAQIKAWVESLEVLPVAAPAAMATATPVPASVPGPKP